MDKLNQNTLSAAAELKPVNWHNPNKVTGLPELPFSIADMRDAEQRLERFAPLIKRLFPETQDGIIESPLVQTDAMKAGLASYYHHDVQGQMFVKCDSHLPVAGSIKARGGIYEVLKHAEELALNAGLLSPDDNYAKLADEANRRFFSQYKIAVGSTGNLGLSIGIMAAALGFQAIVHMSRDAKAWKKQLLRSKGVTVVEHQDDYGKAVEEGRRQCAGDERAHFVDDENSKDLFLGYSVAAFRLAKQLETAGVVVDRDHPLYVYLPCGVGGAPGGITFGLKQLFGDHVHCTFVEPTHSASMLLGLVTRRFSEFHVREYGLDNLTEADGLACGAPSRLVSSMADKLLDGIYTIEDDDLFRLLAILHDSEGIKVEPSAAASLMGPIMVDASEQATHIAWATGGLFLPDEIYREMLAKGRGLLGA